MDVFIQKSHGTARCALWYHSAGLTRPRLDDAACFRFRSKRDGRYRERVKES
jgi:hypothetical protein